MTEVQKILDKYGQKLVERIQKKLIAGGKVASGDLVNSINYRYFFVNGTYTIQISGLKYLVNVDRGRRPGARRPPIQPIVRWLKLKRGILAKGKKRPTARNIESYAYAVATNISKRGIKPFPVLDEAAKIMRTGNYRKEIAQAIAKDAAKQLTLFTASQIRRGI